MQFWESGGMGPAKQSRVFVVPPRVVPVTVFAWMFPIVIIFKAVVVRNKLNIHGWENWCRHGQRPEILRTGIGGTVRPLLPCVLVRRRGAVLTHWTRVRVVGRLKTSSKPHRRNAQPNLRIRPCVIVNGGDHDC